MTWDRQVEIVEERLKSAVADGATIRIGGVRKGQGDLVAKLNAAIAGIHADGTYRQIEQKYFAFRIGEFEAAANN